MTKQDAIVLFGGKNKLIDALGCSRQMIFMWDDELTQAQTDRVIGAAMRHGVATMKNAETLVLGNQQ